MERVSALLAAARAAGLVVAADGDRLVVRGERRHDALARRLLAEKPAVLAWLSGEEREVEWRVAAMRGQMPRSGPVPFLVARQDAPTNGSCLSCGEPKGAGQRFRCRWCAIAARTVLGWEQEGSVGVKVGSQQGIRA